MVYIWIGLTGSALINFGLEEIAHWPPKLTWPFSKAVGENCDLVSLWSCERPHKKNETIRKIYMKQEHYGWKECLGSDND